MLPSILIALIIEISMLYILFIAISKIKFYRTEALFSIILVTISGIIANYFVETTRFTINGIFILTITMIANKRIKNLQLCILYAVLSSIVSVLSGALSDTVLSCVYRVDLSESISKSNELYILYTILTFAIAFCIAQLSGLLIHKRINRFDDHTKKKLVTYLLIVASFTIILYYLYDILGLHGYTNIAEMLYTLALIIFFILFIIAIFVFTDNLSLKININQKDELLKNLQSYTNSIENMVFEVRKFRHDNFNLMLGFYEYIKNNDIDKIRDYFQKYMLSFSENTAKADSRLDILMHMKILEVKSILSFKFLYAQQLGIDVYIEIPEDIDGIEIYNITDLCRITGILLDNAIEACQNAKSSVLRFFAQKRDMQIIFIFTNTYTGTPSISKIFERGFTTKEDGRGLGLYTVSRLIEGNSSLFLKTHIEENEFIQELIVHLN